MSLDDLRLNGKAALVTGGARGLGRAYVLELASLGADVAISDLRLDSARAVGEELTAESVVAEAEVHGVRAIGLEADVTDSAQVSEMVDRAADELGRLDIVVCNAGGPGAGEMEESFASRVSEADLRSAIDLNLHGTIAVCQAALPHLKANGWGKMVTVSTEAALRPFKGGLGAQYVAAKKAVIAYTESLAQEVGRFGITVNAIAPGSIDTALVRSVFSDMDDPKSTANVALRRHGTTADCARVVAFLASPLSDYITGQVITVDGGASLTDAFGASGFEEILDAEERRDQRGS